MSQIISPEEVKRMVNEIFSAALSERSPDLDWLPKDAQMRRDELLAAIEGPKKLIIEEIARLSEHLPVDFERREELHAVIENRIMNVFRIAMEKLGYEFPPDV